jgi:hypothetical protein
MRITGLLAAAALTCVAGSVMAEELDRKTIVELLPCKSAALRLCDRSQGVTAAAMWRCGATLAERQHEIGERCVKVLKRYGQL